MLGADSAAIGPLGFTLTRAEWIQRQDSGALVYEGVDLEDLEVRTYRDAAVVTGRQVGKGAYHGHPMPPRTGSPWSCPRPPAPGSWWPVT